MALQFWKLFLDRIAKEILRCLDERNDIFGNHEVYGDGDTVGVFPREYLDGLFAVEWKCVLERQFGMLCICNDDVIVDQNIKTEVLVHDLDLMTIPRAEVVFSVLDDVDSNNPYDKSSQYIEHYYFLVCCRHTVCVTVAAPGAPIKTERLYSDCCKANDHP